MQHLNTQAGDYKDQEEKRHKEHCITQKITVKHRRVLYNTEEYSRTLESIVDY